MIKQLKVNHDNLRYITLIIVITGILLRLNIYIQNRSIFIDEANLARNIYEKEYADLFSSLGYEQYAPPLFTVAAKGLTRLLGFNESSLRLIPLIASILSIIILAVIVSKLFQVRISRWYVLLLFAFSELDLRYGTEFKQYSSDTTLTLFFILWAIECRHRDFTITLAIHWALAGSVAIWFSMPLVFVLSAIGIIFVIRAWKGQKKNNMIKPLLVSAMWLGSFTVYFYLILYDNSMQVYLQEFHHLYFFDFFPNDVDSFNQSATLLESLFRLATDKTTLAIIWAIIAFLAGSIYLVAKNRYVAGLLLLPIFFCLTASHLHMYSLIGRLVLFMIPLLMIIMGVGISYFWRKSNVWIRTLMVIVMLISVYNKGGYQYFWSKLEIEDSKSVLTYISEHQDGNELIFVHHDAVPAFIFYNKMHQRAYEFDNYYLADVDELPVTLVDHLPGSRQDKIFWVFISHTFPEENVKRIIMSASEVAIEEDRFTSIQASAHLFRLK